MIHTVRLVRTSLFLLVSVAALSLVSGLIYLNQVGFPGSYGEWIRRELDQRGIHLSFETLRYDPTRGIVATRASLFRGADRTAALLEADEMILDLDKTKALRGTFKLLGLAITNGYARIPLQDEDNESFLHANKISGSLEITENGRALLRKTEARIEGIQLDISADLQLAPSAPREPDANSTSPIDQIILAFLDELAAWDLPEDTPPRLSLQLEGDLAKPKLIQTSFELQATQLRRHQYRLEEIKLSGDLRAKVITLDEIFLHDETGTLSGQADWSLEEQDGRFDLTSSLDPKRLFEDCFKTAILPEFQFLSPPSLVLRGRYSVTPDGTLSVRSTGEVNLRDFHYLKTCYDELTSEFSWRDGDLFLRNLTVAHSDRQLTGNVMIAKDQIRFDAVSNLPLTAFQPVIEPGSILESEFSQLTLSPGSEIKTKLRGTIDLAEPRNWTARGSIRIDNFTYKGTRAHHLATHFHLDQDRASFSEVSVLINDDKEPVRLRRGGRASSEILADRVLFDSTTSFITVTNLRGEAWPSPLVRIFAPETADHLEENYRFHQPPRVTLNGRFAGRKEDYELSSFSVGMTTTGQTDYPFLGANLPLTNLRADLIVQGRQIIVKNLTAATLQGSLAGSLVCDLADDRDTRFRGSLKWDQVSFRELSRLYQFDEEEKGLLTGSIDFEGSGNNLRNFNADGILSVKGGNLVAIPILGPLSPLIASLLQDRRMGYERAKDASAHFAVRNGVLRTKDFVAISTNITLTGDGWIDLKTDQLNMIIRVNARGLLGLLSLPLQPLRGIFQFRGTGTYDQPVWQNSPFTRPPKGENDPIFRRPAKGTIVTE